MESKVKVTADAAGNVVVPSKNNPEWGYIRLVQIRNVVDDRGFGRRRPASALVQGTIEDLTAFGWKKDQELEGCIIFKEQLTPFNLKEPERDEKVAGVTKVKCRVNGQVIYRKSFYTKKANAEDVLVEHTNKEEIKAAYANVDHSPATGEDTADLSK